MDFSLELLKQWMTSDFAIDMGLNVAGFITAGMLMFVMHSIFRGNRKQAHTTAHDNAPASVADHPPDSSEAARLTTPVEGPRRIEFVKFQQAAQSSPLPQNRMARANGINPGGRRNRAEVIKIARVMLDAGASDDNIRRVLPISESELSLLRLKKVE